MLNSEVRDLKGEVRSRMVHVVDPRPLPPWVELQLNGFPMGDSEGGMVEHFSMLPPTFSEALDEGGHTLGQWGDCNVQCVCRQGGVWFSLCSVYTPDRRRYRLLTVESLCVVRSYSVVDVARGMLYALARCSFACGSGPTAYRAMPDAISVRYNANSELMKLFTPVSSLPRM